MTKCSNCGRPLVAEARFCAECGTQVVTVPSAEDPLLGRTLMGKYRVLARIGEGSMGTVYEAEHIGLKKRLAVKVLHRELGLGDETLQRFQREGIAAGKFNHPNAIQVFDFDRTDDGTIFLAMEFVDGEDLRATLNREGRQQVERVADIVDQVLGALGEAHEHGIVHRDLKPENIMIVPGAGAGRGVKVLDFGLSKLVDVPLDASTLKTIPGRVLGTPLYMAPEQSVGREVDHRSDLYAVGLILFELLSGERPFQGGNFNELIIKQATEPAPSLADTMDGSDLPQGLEALVSRALEKLPEDRFQSAEEMRTELAALDPSRTETLHARPRLEARADKGPKPRTRAIVAGLLLVVLTLLAGRFLLPSTIGGGSDFARASEKPAAERDEEESRYLSTLGRARGALSGGDTKAALSAVNEALGLSVVDSEAYLLRGHVYRARRDDDTALADYVEALRIDPTYAEAAASIGWIELDRDQLGAAQARFEEAVAHDGNSALAIAGMGAVLAARGDAGAAFDELERAVAIDGTCAPAQFQLGSMLFARGAATAAVDALIAAKRSDPSSIPILIILGEAYAAEDRPQDAETQFRAALELDADDFDAQCALGSLLVELGRHTEALELVSEPLQRHPDRIELAVLAGVAHDARGETTRAITRLEEAVAAGAESAEVARLLGALYLREGAADPAVEQFRRAADLSDEDAGAWLDLGLALLTLERVDEAGEAVDTALEIDTDLPAAHLVRGVLHMDYFGEPTQAMESLQRYVDLGGEDPRVAGWLFELGG